MIVIDDNMLRLAKMQETLLKMSVDNREENVKKYCQIVTDIDKKAFLSLLDYISQVNKHNRTLEEELEFLEQVKSYYDQINELQFSFKNVSDCYGGQLELSDLSRIDIEYVENRISSISGYLINKKNLEINKKRLKELSDKLVIEEKNNKRFVEELLEYEELLRNIFLNSEGRAVIDGNLSYISVITEYDKIGYDFKELLVDIEKLEVELNLVTAKKDTAGEKLKTAEICYNAMPSLDSKSIYDEINKEYLQEKYKFIMLKIVQLLSKSYDNFELVINKRNDLIDLIKGRKKCLDVLGVYISFDPFSVDKVMEQLNDISKKDNNSKIINNLLKSIAELSERIESMEYQTDEYLLGINEVSDIVVSNVGISDIDISSVVLDFDVVEEKKEVLANQVVLVKEITDKFNMSIVGQKARSVIKRVCEMINTIKQEEKEDDVVVAPELVIVSSPVIKVEDELTVETAEADLIDEVQVPSVDEKVVSEENSVDDVVTEKTSLIFETMDPFVETPLFLEKSEDFDGRLIEDEKKVLSNVDEEVMPDAFWVTQGNGIKKLEDDVILSFDEQIDALLSSDDSTKIRKKIA